MIHHFSLTCRQWCSRPVTSHIRYNLNMTCEKTVLSIVYQGLRLGRQLMGLGTMYPETSPRPLCNFKKLPTLYNMIYLYDCDREAITISDHYIFVSARRPLWTERIGADGKTLSLSCLIWSGPDLRYLMEGKGWPASQCKELSALAPCGAA